MEFTEHLNEFERSALGFILACVDVEADRMRDADPENYDEHGPAITALGAHLESGEAFGLNDDEAAAVRYLLEAGDWGTVIGPDEGDQEGLKALRFRVTGLIADPGPIC